MPNICKHCKEELSQKWADNLVDEKNICEACWWDLKKHGYALYRIERGALRQIQEEKDKEIQKRRTVYAKKQRAIRKQKKTKEFRALFGKTGG